MCVYYTLRTPADAVCDVIYCVYVCAMVYCGCDVYVCYDILRMRCVRCNYILRAMYMCAMVYCGCDVIICCVTLCAM